MKKLRHILFSSWYKLETLDDRIYHIILDVAVFICVGTLVTDLILHSPKSALLSSAINLLFVIILQYITMRYPKYSNYCRIALVLGLNFVFLPISFFSSGGIYSGRILFFVLGMAMCAVLLHGNTGGIIFLISSLWMELCITLSVHFPQYVQQMTVNQHRKSMKSTLLMTGIALYSIILLIFREYAAEKARSESLMQKLNELSITDALSGLYNRRELFRRLEVMYDNKPKERTETLTLKNRYIAMFDVDDFKKLNDTYGHSFGDSVLLSVAEVLHGMVFPERGELTARYGGEEFVSIIVADNSEQAYERIDEVRRKIESLRWEEHPEVCVTISGGLLSCEENPDLTMALHDVDAKLYEAKAAGKNRICILEKKK